MTSTLFHGGTIWRGADEPTAGAVFVREGVVEALDVVARRLAAEAESAGEHVEQVDLDGGFLMPAFGDGHAHPVEITTHDWSQRGEIPISSVTKKPMKRADLTKIRAILGR